MFITFEGIEGTGKSTQAKLVREWLSQLGHDVILTREPGGTPVGDQVRQVLLRPGNDMEPLTELFLLQASRRELCSKVIRPALEAGKTVLVDRFGDSSVAYQGYGRGLDIEVVEGIIERATDGLKPNVTVLFDIDPEKGLERSRGLVKSEREGFEKDRVESESITFFRKVRRGFLEMASQEPDRFRVICVTGGVEETFEMVKDELTPFLAV